MDPITGFLINLIIGVVLSAASTLLQQAFAPKNDQKRQTGTRGSAQIGGKVSQYFLVGTVGEAGKLEYRNTWGSPGATPNAYLVDVHSFGDLPIADLTGLYVNGVRVTLSTAISLSPGYAVPEYPDNLWWKFFDGTQTTADSYLISAFGADAERPWSSDMVGRGVPYLITTALWGGALWTGIPAILGEFQGIKLYDPRKDSTAGGSGTQRWSNPSTWAFSDNNMVIIYNIERGIYYDGAHVWGGKKTAAELPYDSWAAAMDACDMPINLVGGGTEKQFRAGRRIALNERPGDVIKEFLIGCNGRIVHCADGTVYPLVGVPDAVDFSFTDADVLATNDLGTIPFPNLDEIINGATATYREPSQAWEDKETAPYLRADLEAEDDGRQQIEGLDLGTTFSGTQAQRVIKAVIEEGRRFRRHVVALPPEYAQFQPLQVLAWTSDRFDYSAKLFLITARTIEPFGNVILGLQEVDPADHDWNPATDEQPLSFAPVVTNRPPPQEVSGFYVEPAIAYDSEGQPRRPAIDAFWPSAAVTVDVREVRITVVLPDGDDPDEPGDLVWEGAAPRPELGGARLTQALLPDEDYLVQIQYLPESGRATLASSWQPVTTPDVKLGSSDIDINFEEIAGEVVEDLKFLSVGFRNLQSNFERLGTLVSEQDAANFNDRQVLTRQLNKKTGDLQASFTEIIEVALGPGGAIAQSLSALYAAMGGSSSEVLVRWATEATPVGVTARWGVQLSTDDGDTFGSAAALAQVRDGESEWVFDADRTVVTANGGETVIAVFEGDGDGQAKFRNALIQNLTAENIQTGTLTGDLLVAESITSNEIDVEELVASSAFLNNLVVGTANIGTAVVGTLQLANGAVTSKYQVIISSPQLSPSSSVAAVTVPATTNPVEVSVYAEIQPYNPGTSNTDAVYYLETTAGDILDQIIVAPILVAPNGGPPTTIRLKFNGFARRPGNAVTYQLRSSASFTNQYVTYLVLTATVLQR